MFEFDCKAGVFKPISHTIEKMSVFLITPTGNEVNLYSAVDQGLASIKPIISTNPGQAQTTYQTQHKYVKIFIQKKRVNLNMFWSWIFELDPTKFIIDVYSFSKSKGPLFFSGRGRILTKEEILASSIFSDLSKKWATDELHKPAANTLNELVVLHKPDPKSKLRKLGIKKEGVTI